ncbi:hypothetical protein C7974DRAFT_370437 [Boeremia exigua]|uniref:uncharacterized protein n=1 Tax=Boeremia exigua TaxID=749465 RepID=UPI001E8EB931|nr:uncharacterized protein C7974DRAFT_370437 [Boeremia exigua]KAH6612061.1 hypothetical protein C7974DRAFT_370437 [Boeremia exigua]
MRSWYAMHSKMSWLLLALCFWTAAASSQSPPKTPEARGYSIGELIPVTCLNRTIDTGEHITDPNGQLQYIPFPTCAETARPLELAFGVEREINCTIAFVSDALYHLLEFYIHSDAPLTCRVPSRPLGSTALAAFGVEDAEAQEGALGSRSTAYTPLVVGLAGALQLSHLHVGHSLNLLLHGVGGGVEAATAYSVAPHTRNTKLAIGDALTLSFSVRWYKTTQLPAGWEGYGGHVYVSTLVYCALSALAGAAVAGVWFRGVELPRRVRGFARERIGGGGGGFGMGGMRGGGGGGYGLPVANGGGNGGYGYGVGGYGVGGGYGGGVGKKD